MANGLPILSSNILSLVETAQLDASALALLFGGGADRVWGIFGANAIGTTAEVLTGYSSVLGFQFQGDEQVPDYPIEQGGFVSYNKVRVPSVFKLQYTVNGGAGAINSFLSQCGLLRGDTTLYEVVTPNFTYANTNFVHYDYRQMGGAAGGRATGVSMLVVDVWMREIRSAVTAQFSNTGQGTQASGTNTGSPDGQAQVNGATVQAVGSSTLTPSPNTVTYGQISGQTVAPQPASQPITPSGGSGNGF